MSFSETIEHAESVFLDTAPIIYFIEAHPIYGPLVKQLVSAFSEGLITAHSSVITLAEVLPAPLRAKNKKLAGLFADFLKHGKNLDMVPISAEIAEAAGRLRARHPALKAFDAMQLAAALHVKAKLFVTNDKKLKNVREIHVLVLEDHAVHPLGNDLQEQ
jgi:predicted nucleic acid-binding protein